MSATYYKVLGDRQNSFHGGRGEWAKGRWRTVEGPLEPCRNGIHFCRADQLLGWLGPQVWVFEDGSPDETIDAGDKMVTRRGRVVERLDTWNETTARLFAAGCAEAVLPVFERERPGDDSEPPANDGVFARTARPQAVPQGTPGATQPQQGRTSGSAPDGGPEA